MKNTHPISKQRTVAKACSFGAITLGVLCGASAFAQVSYDAETSEIRKNAPAWVDTSIPDVRAFRFMVGPEALPSNTDRTVPGVVEVPLAGIISDDTEAILQRSDGSFAPAYLFSREEQTRIVYTGAEGRVIPDDPREVVRNVTPDGSPDVLVDGDRTTMLQFEYFDDAVNTATIMVRYERPITTDTFRVYRASNVALPLEVRIRASGDDGEMRNILANTKQYGDQLNFPQTTSDYFEVTFTITQPLRMSEVSFVEQGPRGVTYAVRYLAVPGDAPTLYLGSDRPYGTLSTGGVSLTDERDIEVSGGVAVLAPNPRYEPADTDNDSVPNMRDNCPTIANFDQLDSNGNGEGDMCDDHDRDGIVANKDNCPDTPNRDQRDTDGDEVGDACDGEESRFTEANPWVPWVGVLIAGSVIAGLMVLVVRQERRPRDRSDTEVPQGGAS